MFNNLQRKPYLQEFSDFAEYNRQDNLSSCFHFLLSLMIKIMYKTPKSTFEVEFEQVLLLIVNKRLSL